MQMELSSTSDGRTSSSVEQQKGEFWKKPLKEEETDEDDDFIYGETSSTLEDLTPEDQQNLGLQIVLKEEEPEHDDYLYCEDCKSFFVNKCDVHGPALFIPDVAVPLGVAERAKQTLPPGLEIRKSSIPDAGVGVFNNSDTIPVGAHFGPYQGDTVERQEAIDSSYSWVVYQSDQCEKYIDATSEMNSNWMRYVNCARNEREQNLVAFQYQGGILFRCSQPIEPGQELLMWYEEEYAKDVTFDFLWNKKCSENSYVHTLLVNLNTEDLIQSPGTGNGKRKAQSRVGSRPLETREMEKGKTTSNYPQIPPPSTKKSTNPNPDLIHTPMPVESSLNQPQGQNRVKLRVRVKLATYSPRTRHRNIQNLFD